MIVSRARDQSCLLVLLAFGDLMRFLKTFAAVPLLFAGAAMAQAPTFQPVGTVRQVMLGIVKPTSDVVFKFQFDPPKNAEEWAALQNNALNLAEAGNLLLLPGRAKDKGEWTKNAKALVETGSQAFKAANAKDSKALEEIGNKIDDTCEACHAIYLPKPPE
jgi:hypothetical protein